jgi:nucleoside-triphosphatase THEP1
MTSKESTRLALVTGDIEVGKTTVVGRVVELARSRGYVCAGVWSPAHIVDGHKTGIETVDLSTGERRLLAHMATEGTEMQLGRYVFAPTVLAWANDVLAKAIAAQPDLLIIDEIGPLELEQRDGLAPALAPLAAGRVPRALVIVRAWLVDAFQARLPGIPTVVFVVEAKTRQSLPARMVDWLFETQQE